MNLNWLYLVLIFYCSSRAVSSDSEFYDDLPPLLFALVVIYRYLFHDMHVYKEKKEQIDLTQSMTQAVICILSENESKETAQRRHQKRWLYNDCGPTPDGQLEYLLLFNWCG